MIDASEHFRALELCPVDLVQVEAPDDGHCDGCLDVCNPGCEGNGSNNADRGLVSSLYSNVHISTPQFGAVKVKPVCMATW